MEETVGLDRKEWIKHFGGFIENNELCGGRLILTNYFLGMPKFLVSPWVLPNFQRLDRELSELDL